MIQGRKGYTLVEIMIVVAILAVLLSVAIPNYLKSGKNTSKNSCIVNLRQIDSAMEQWAIENNIVAGTVLGAMEESEVYAYVDGGMPSCPSGGEYSLHAVGSRPQVTCSREDEGHILPD